MADHMWVTMQYTPLEITQMPDGSLKVEATEAAIEAAVEDSLMGCWFCHEPLTAESYGTECTAPQSDQAI